MLRYRPGILAARRITPDAEEMRATGDTTSTANGSRSAGVLTIVPMAKRGNCLDRLAASDLVWRYYSLATTDSLKP